MAHTSLFLYRASADGALSQSSGRGHGAAASSYSLLGIPMMDMEVLKATQVVFTALGIVVTMLGVPVVLWSDTLFKAEGSTPGWVFSFGFLVVLAGTKTLQE
ncbi:unnamed protein product [Prorocentrum cordatum]|uniref:Uncharacterized protein n=1 Tax=Prorocentrum cordatum TaxID=2364126 RepID=A0ABN9SHB6_9DINO|nr:unnamed protein product [Polarella glacialis]